MTSVIWRVTRVHIHPEMSRTRSKETAMGGTDSNIVLSFQRFKMFIHALHRCLSLLLKAEHIFALTPVLSNFPCEHLGNIHYSSGSSAGLIITPLFVVSGNRYAAQPFALVLFLVQGNTILKRTERDSHNWTRRRSRSDHRMPGRAVSPPIMVRRCWPSSEG